MVNKIHCTDYFESKSKFANFIERYLHVNGMGRKFKILKSVKGNLAYTEVIDLMNSKKILGNIARIASYIFFPLPLACLVIRKWQRSGKKVALSSFKEDPLKKQAYIDLKNENINAPFFKTETLPEKLNYHLVNIKEELNHKNYAQIIDQFNTYPALAPKALQLFVKAIEHGNTKGTEIALITLKYLNSNDSDAIPESDRKKSVEKLQKYLRDKIENTKIALEVIEDFLSAIHPTNKDTSTFIQSLVDSEEAFNQGLLQVVYELNPSFWEEEKKTLEDLAAKQPTFNLSIAAIKNAALFVRYIEKKQAYASSV